MLPLLNNGKSQLIHEPPQYSSPRVRLLNFSNYFLRRNLVFWSAEFNFVVFSGNILGVFNCAFSESGQTLQSVNLELLLAVRVVCGFDHRFRLGDS